MKLLNYFIVLLFASFMSCNSPDQRGEGEATVEETEVYSEADIKESENLEKEAEELEQDVDKLINEI